MNCEQCKEDRKCLDGLCIGCWKARAEKDEAAAAEMRDYIVIRSQLSQEEDFRLMYHALSSDAGKDWMSPQDAMDLQVQLGGWERAANMLREGMGLDASQTDLRECLLTFDAIKTKLAIAVEALDRLKNFPCDRPVSSIAREALAKLKEEKA